MMHPAKFLAMALLCGPPGVLSHGEGQLRAPLPITEPAGLSPNRISAEAVSDALSRTLRSEATEATDGVFASHVQRLRLIVLGLFAGACFMIVGCMFHPPGGGGGAQANMRVPPRWEPTMETTLPFRTWMQDLMLWTICTDLTPPQQTAAIISQLGGAARELARTLTPAEVYQGGVVHGLHVDPVSFLLHGLSARCIKEHPMPPDTIVL